MIESFNNIDMSTRTPCNTDNSLHIYKARAYALCGVGDDRIQVRILPYMLDIPENELKNLPIYTPFFRGQALKVPTETDSPGSIGTLLWVAATPDFTFGYILGEANINTGSGESDKLLDSWPYSKIKNFLTTINASSEDFDYKNIMVDIRSPSGTYMEFHSIVSGEKWMLSSKGDIIHMQPGKIVLQASEGVDSESAKSNIIITPDKVEVTTQLFSVNAKKVILGKHNHKLLGTIASSSVSCDGVNLKPIENIFV